MPTHGQHFRFGRFELDCASGELRKSGVRIHLEDQPFRLLAALVERQGEVVSREELKAALWASDTYVDFDRSLTKAINKVRVALSDSAANPRFIETLPRRGYRFVAPVAAGDVEAPPGEPETPVRQPTRSRRVVTVAVLAFAAAVAAGAWIVTNRTSHARVSTIAVLPFTTPPGDPQQGYFGDSVTNRLIDALSRIRSLKVVSRQSVMRYKGTRKEHAEIARELGVQAVVEGSVVQSDGRVRIEARVIRVVAGQAAWERMYERSASDVLTLESELARNIAQELDAALTPAEEKRVARHLGSVDPKLDALYRAGRFFANEPSREMLDRAVQTLEDVVRKDPSHAPAYTAMAEAWYGLSSYHLPPVDAMPKAKAAARKAILLDPESDAAHAVLGRVHLFYDWDWQAAGEHFNRALDLNPNSSAAYRGLADLRMAEGRAEEALRAIDRALQLNPMFVWPHLEKTQILTNSRRFDDAIRYARQALEWEPSFGVLRAILGVTHAEKHEFADAVREVEAAVKSQRIPTTLSFLAQGYALSGRKSEAEKVLSELVAVTNSHYVCPFEVATAFASLGRHDETFKWMQKGVGARADCMIWLRAEPWLQPIRKDPRYARLVRQVGFQ